MPGNKIGDRVHNFFEQEHLSPGQRHSQIADVNWVGGNNNRWDISQRQYDNALSFKIKDYSPQQSGIYDLSTGTCRLLLLQVSILLRLYLFLLIWDISNYLTAYKV